MKCRLDHRDNPFYYLKPIKVEELHYNPEIIMFHDLVSTKEMKAIRLAAAPLVCIQLTFNVLNKSRSKYLLLHYTYFYMEYTFKRIQCYGRKFSLLIIQQCNFLLPRSSTAGILIFFKYLHLLSTISIKSKPF